jgi:hypothetical protein
VFVSSLVVYYLFYFIQLYCALSEWQCGYPSDLAFSGAVYGKVYVARNKLIKHDQYHWNKFVKTSQQWPQGGQQVLHLSFFNQY